MKSELLSLGSQADAFNARVAGNVQASTARLSTSASAATTARNAVSAFGAATAASASAQTAAASAARSNATATGQVSAASNAASRSSTLLADAQGKVDSGFVRVARSGLAAVAVFASVSTAAAQVTRSLSDFRDLERTLAAVEVVAGATTNEMRVLREATVALGEGSIYHLGSIAESSEALARSGLNVARITATLPAILNLATAASVDLGEATEVVVNTQHAFGISARDSVMIADNLALAANRTSTEVGQLGEGLKYVGPISRALGKDLSETTAGLGVLSNAGMQASMAGTGLRRVFSELAAPTAVAERTLKEIGLTIEDVTPTTNSLAAIVLKLAAAGLDAGQAFKIFGDRGAPAIINLVNQAPRLVELTNELRSVRGESALMAERLLDTLYGSELAFRTTAESVRISLGEVMAPAMREVRDEFRALLTDSRGELTDFGQSLASAIRTGGEALELLVRNLDLLKVSLLALLALKMATWFVGFVRSVQTAATALLGYSAASGTAAASTAALGATVARTSPILDQYGRAIVTTTAATNTATATSGKFLSMGVTPLAVGLTALLGVLLFVNDKIVDFSESTQREITAIINATNDFAQRLRDFRRETEEALDEKRAMAEIEKRILSEGLETDSDAANFLREQVALEFQRKRVDLLYEQREALDTAAEGVKRYGAELEALRRTEAEQAAEVDSLGGPGRPSAPSSRNSEGLIPDEDLDRLNRAQQELAATRERISETEVALNRAKIEQAQLTESTERLTTATAGFRDEQKLLTDEVNLSGTASEEQQKKFEKVRKSIEMQVSALGMLAAVYDQSEDARQEALDAVEVENRLRQEAADLTDEQAAALRPLIANLIEAQRVSEGAKTISDLQIQRREIDALNAASARGTTAMATTRRALEVEARVRAATATAAASQRAEIESLIRSLAAEEDRLRANELADNLTIEVGQLQELIAAYKEGPAAVQATVAAHEREALIRQQLAGLTEEQAAKLKPLIEMYADLRSEAEKASVLSQFDRQIDALERESEIRRSSFRTVEEYAEAVRQLNIQLEVERAILSSKEPLSLDDIVAIRQKIAAISDLRKAMEEASETEQTLTEKMSGFGRALQGFDFADEQIDAVADGMGKMIDGFAGMTEAAKLFSKEAALGWATMLQGLDQTLQAMGAYQTGNGGGFGGSSEGNYAAEGQMIGAVIGGIIGAFAGMPQVGMAIGGAAGGILGGFVKKGADEALATLRIDTSGFAVAVRKAEGGLGSAITGLGADIARALNEVLLAIGGEIGSLPAVDMKIRDGVISLVVGGVKQRFKEMDDAISFAVAELLKQGEILGIDEMLRSALKNTNADSLEQLAGDLEAVMQVLSFGLSDGQQAIQSATQELDALRSRMLSLISDSAQLERALSNINMEEARRWQTLRDQITGHQRTAAEERAFREQEAILYNAEKALRIAELQMKLETLKAEAEIGKARARFAQTELEIDAGLLDGQRISIEGQGDLLMAQTELWQQQFSNERTAFGIRADLVSANQNLMRHDLIVRREYTGASLELLNTQIAALEQVIAALQAIPDIQLGEIRLPNISGTVGGEIGGIDDTESRIESFWDFVRGHMDAGLSDLESQLAELDRAFAEHAETAAEVAGGEEALAAARAAALEQIREEIIDGLGLPMESLRDRFDRLREELAFLEEQATASAAGIERTATETGQLTEQEQRLAQIRAELILEAESELLGLAAQLAEAFGLDKDAAEFNRMLREAELAFKVAEFNFLFAQYSALGLISEEVQIRLKDLLGIINDPANWPDFDPPEPPPTTSTQDSSGVDDKNRFLEEMAEQIREWMSLGMGDAQREAIALRERFEELRDEAQRLGISTGELTSAYRFAADHMIDEILAPFEDLDLDPLEIELRDLREEFLDYAAAFAEIGASAEQMAALEQARIEALEDFWQRATEGLRDLLDEMRGDDPRLSPRDQFEEAQERFRELAARAAAGDLGALAELQDAAGEYRDAISAYLGEGVGSFRFRDEITDTLEQLLSDNPFLTDAEAAQLPVTNRIDRTNALLTSIAERLGAGIPVMPASDSLAARSFRPGSSLFAAEAPGPSSNGGGAAQSDRLAVVLSDLAAMLEANAKRESEDKKAKASRSFAAAVASRGQSQEELLAEVVALLSQLVAKAPGGPPAGR